MSPNSYDVIVLGVGGMGASAAFELALRGRRVLGLEQFNLVHDRGSSHGQTRIIRKAYFEHPAYVPLLQRSYERWYQLEQRCGRRLFTECGCLNFGPPSGTLVPGVRLSAAQHKLPIEDLSAEDIRRRFPAFRFGDDMVGVLERDAGFLYVEDCVAAYIEEARRLGADLRAGERAVSWEAAANGVTVRTEKDTYTAKRLVITAGSWAGRVLHDLGLPLQVTRKVLLWFGTANDALFRRDVFPVYIGEVPLGRFYGFPMIDGNGAKVAQHDGRDVVPDPDQVDRTVRQADEDVCRGFLREHLPAVNGPLRAGRVCMYTMTPDENFIIDLHPHHPNVAIAGGFSGHGFKFASVVGELLADLVELGKTKLPIDVLRLGRFAVR